MKNRQWAATLMMGLLSLSAQADVAVTAANLKELVTSGNMSLRAKNLEVQATDERRGGLARSFLPSIEVGIGAETFKVGRDDVKTQPEYGIEARVNLWNGGRDQIRSKLRDLEFLSAKDSQRRLDAEVYSKASTYYWQSLYFRDLLDALKQAEALNQNSLQAADRRIRSGVATQIDRLEFQMQASDLARARQQAELDFTIRRDLLALILGIEDSITLKEKMEHGHDFEAKLQHSEGVMDYWLTDSKISAERAGAESAEAARAFWPRIEAVAGYQQLTELEEDPVLAQDRTEAYVGLKLRLSLASGFEDRRVARAKILESEALKLRFESDRREMSLHMKSEVQELRRMHDQVHDFEDTIGRADRYLQMTQNEYGRGVKNSPDVLGANTKLLEARIKRLESIRDFQIAKSHLLAKLGK